MTRLFANPFIVAVHAALLHRLPNRFRRERRGGNRTLAHSSRKSPKAARFAARQVPIAK
jgi:hypothetical protein